MDWYVQGVIDAKNGMEFSPPAEFSQEGRTMYPSPTVPDIFVTNFVAYHNGWNDQKMGLMKECAQCGEYIHTDEWGSILSPMDEYAEVVRNGKHVLVHAECMQGGEEIA